MRVSDVGPHRQARRQALMDHCPEGARRGGGREAPRQRFAFRIAECEERSGMPSPSDVSGSPSFF